MSAAFSHWDVIGMYREMLTGITAAVAQNTGKNRQHRF